MAACAKRTFRFTGHNIEGSPNSIQTENQEIGQGYLVAPTHTNQPSSENRWSDQRDPTQDTGGPDDHPAIYVILPLKSAMYPESTARCWYDTCRMNASKWPAYARGRFRFTGRDIQISSDNMPTANQDFGLGPIVTATQTDHSSAENAWSDHFYAGHSPDDHPATWFSIWMEDVLTVCDTLLVCEICRVSEAWWWSMNGCPSEE